MAFHHSIFLALKGLIFVRILLLTLFLAFSCVGTRVRTVTRVNLLQSSSFLFFSDDFPSTGGIL